MKIRSGFVSNSSSSSFIVGVTKVTDEQKLREYLKSKNIDLDKARRSFGIQKVSQDQNDDITFKDGCVRVSSFETDVTLRNVSDGDTIFYVNYYGNEGDGSFTICDDDGEFLDLDYDIDLDFFGQTEQNLYEIFGTENIGIDPSTSDVTFGAGRNG